MCQQILNIIFKSFSLYSPILQYANMTMQSFPTISYNPLHFPSVTLYSLLISFPSPPLLSSPALPILPLASPLTSLSSTPLPPYQYFLKSPILLPLLIQVTLTSFHFYPTTLTKLTFSLLPLPAHTLIFPAYYYISTLTFLSSPHLYSLPATYLPYLPTLPTHPTYPPYLPTLYPHPYFSLVIFTL